MKDFEDTKGLSNDDLQAALVHGDARDRVFAIWALALRSPHALSFNHQVRGEPDPGVRRGLAVVLAAHGEIDLLVAMSRHDPSVHVRASTTQILVRFAAAGQVPWILVEERLADEPEVRAAVFSQLDAASPDKLREAARKGLFDGDEMIRREAFETCARLARAGVLDVSLLREQLENTLEQERAHLISVWFKIESPESLCALLATSSLYVRRQIALMYPEHARAALRPWLEDVELYEVVARPLGLDLAGASLRLVLELAARSAARGWSPALLDECIARLQRIDVLPAELRSLARSVHDAFGEPEPAPGDGELVPVDDDDDDWGDAQERDWFAALDARRAQLRSLLVAKLAP